MHTYINYSWIPPSASAARHPGCICFQDRLLSRHPPPNGSDSSFGRQASVMSGRQHVDMRFGHIRISSLGKGWPGQPCKSRIGF